MKPKNARTLSFQAPRLFIALAGLVMSLSNTAQAVDTFKTNTTTMHLAGDWTAGVPTIANALRPSWNNNTITAANNLLVTLGGDIACIGMDLRPFGSSGPTLKIGSGNTLGLTGTVIQQDNGGWDSTLDCGIQLLGNTTFSVQGDIIINGSITQDATPRSLTKNTNSGALHLTAANSYTGGTTITAGILSLGGSGTLGATTGNVTLNAQGAILDLGGLTRTNATVDFNRGFVQNGTLIANAYNTGLGLVTANLQGATAPLAANNSGGLILSGTNTYGGTTTIGGWLRATHPAALPNSGASGTFTINNASGFLAVRAGAASGEWTSGNIDSLLSNLTFTVTAGGGALGIDTTGGNFSYGSVIPAKTNLGFRKIGPNTLTLTAANLYPNRTTVARGTLKIDAGAGASLVSSSALTFAGTGTFDYDNTTAVGATTQTLGALNVVAASANDNTTTATEATVQLTRTAAQTTDLKFASLAARVAGGTLNFKVAGTPGTNGTDSKIWFTTPLATGAFLNQGSFFGGSGYAAYDVGGFLRAMDYASDTDGLSVGGNTDFTAAGANGKHVDLTGSITAGITESIKSLRIGGTSGVTLGAGNTLTLASGGILKTGGGTSTITGGTRLSTLGLTELVIRTDASSDKLTINSPILVALTRTGTTASGTAIVTGLSQTSDLVVGMAVVVTGGSTRTISTIDSATQVTLNGNSGFTGTPLIFFGDNTVTKSGEGTLELGGVNTFNHLRLNAGRLNFTSQTNLPATAVLTIGEGTTLDNASGGNLTVGGSGLSTRIAGSFTYLGTGGDLTLGTDGAFNSFPNDSTITVAAKTLRIFKELVTYSTAAVTKNGPGTLGFTGNGQNQFVGGLTINNGVVAGGANGNNNQTAGVGPVTLGDTSGANPATLYLANSAGNGSPLTARAGSSGTLALVSETGQNPRWEGPVTLNNALTLASINGSSGTLNLYGVISGSSTLNIGNTGSIEVSSATKTLANQGTVRLFRENTYTGNTLVNSGSLRLGALAKIDSTPLISLAAGATLDVSDIASYTLSSSTTLVAKGTGTTPGTTRATIKAGTTVSLGTQPVNLTFTPTSGSGDTTHPSLVVSQGALTLSNNTISVINNGPALATGVYTLIQTPGAITGVPNTAAVTVTGSGGLAANSEAFASVSGNDVILTVATKLVASFTGLPLSQTIQAGTANVTLSGTVEAPGPVYPADGETVHVTINGVTNNTTTSGGTGSFSIVFPTSTLPGSPGAGISYPITYTYDTSATLTAATDATTALTVTTQLVPTINSWPTTAGLTYGDALTVASLTGGSASVPGTFTYTFPSTIPGAVGTYLASGKFTPTDNVTYSTVIVPAVINVSVAQKELTIASPAVTTRPYNAGFDATITGTLTGVLAGDIGLVTLVGTGLFDTATPGVGISVDPSSSTITGSQSGNYYLTVPFGLTGTITAATLTVTADNKGRPTGVANPTLTSTVTGYQGADDATSVGLTGAPVLATSAIPASPAGPYPITCAAGTVAITDPNYTLAFAPGTLNVIGLATWAKGSQTWDINTSVNWTNPALTPVTYVDGGAVSFPDTSFASPFTVTLNTTVSPASVTMNNPTKDYTISGTGSIGGAGSLTKTGAGALTLGTANTYSGGTTVDACTLSPQNRLVFGSGPVTLAGGVNIIQGFDGNSAGGAYPNTFTLSGGAVSVDVSFSPGKDTWFNTVISGPGSFVVKGDGRSQGLTLQASNTFSGGVTLGLPGSTEGPNVQLFNVNSLGTGTLRSELKGTDLTKGGLRIQADLSAGVLNPIDLVTTARLVVNTNPDGTANPVLFSGPITGGGSLVKIGTGTMTLSNSANTYSGNTLVNGGTLSLADDAQLQFVLGATSGVSNSISGAGTAVLDGNFLIDTTAANALTSGTWTLENVPSLTGIYGSTFTVVGFAPNINDDTWTKTAPGKIWTFVESTGVLTLTSDSDFLTWAATYLPGADVSDPAADNDGDGLTNQQEYAFGLNPTLGSSVNPITVPLNKTTGMFTYTRRATPLTTGLTYSVQTSTDLAIWPTDVTATQTVTGTVGDVQTVDVTLSGTIPLTAPSIFVRIKATP